jgi:hypothetical protein
LRARRVYLTVTAQPTQLAFEAVGRGRKRIARLHPEHARALALDEDAMLELLADGGAPLRAWLRIDAAAPQGQIALDESAQRVLRSTPGARVQARALYRAMLG